MQTAVSPELRAVYPAREEVFPVRRAVYLAQKEAFPVRRVKEAAAVPAVRTRCPR